ncbi:hypothetical protein LguiA_022423 [Lonicera macranthoides]
MNQGNRLDGKFAWKAVSWTAAINALREGLNIYVTKGNIQSRLKTWEKHHEIISNMLSTSGFSWNYDKGRVEVEERVWNAYVQVHTKAVPYRRVWNHVLMHDQRKFDTFSGLPAELKKPWILMHLGC